MVPLLIFESLDRRQNLACKTVTRSLEHRRAVPCAPATFTKGALRAFGRSFVGVNESAGKARSSGQCWPTDVTRATAVTRLLHCQLPLTKRSKVIRLPRHCQQICGLTLQLVNAERRGRSQYVERLADGSIRLAVTTVECRRTACAGRSRVSRGVSRW
jgi:hypothetical protein